MTSEQEIEVRDIRRRLHVLESHVTRLNIEVGMLKDHTGKTGNMLDGWRNWAMSALFGAVVYLVLNYVLPGGH